MATEAQCVSPPMLPLPAVRLAPAPPPLAAPLVSVTSVEQLSVKDIIRFLDCVWEYGCAVSAFTEEDRTSDTPFHSVSEPDIKLSDYAVSIAKHHRLTRSCVIVAVLFIGRYAQNTGHPLSALSAHRLFATALLLAAKASCDIDIRNKDVAVSAGMSNSELNSLEVHLLQGIDHAMYIAPHEYAATLDSLRVAAGRVLRSDIVSSVAAAMGCPTPRRRPRTGHDLSVLSSSENTPRNSLLAVGPQMLALPVLDGGRSPLMKSGAGEGSAYDSSEFSTQSSWASFGLTSPVGTPSRGLGAAGRIVSAARLLRTRPDPAATFSTPVDTPLSLPTFASSVVLPLPTTEAPLPIVVSSPQPMVPAPPRGQQRVGCAFRH